MKHLWKVLLPMCALLSSTWAADTVAIPFTGGSYTYDAQGNLLEGVQVRLATAGIVTSTDQWGSWTVKLPDTTIKAAAEAAKATLSVMKRLGSAKVTPTPNLAMTGNRIFLSYGGVNILGRQTGNLMMPKMKAVMAARKMTYAGPDTIIYSWKGVARRRIILNSYVKLLPSAKTPYQINLNIYIDTSANWQTSRYPWNENIRYDTVWDDKDGQPYRSVKIGQQTWLAENLRFTPAQSGGLINPSDRNQYRGQAIDSVLKYGALYSWKEVMNLNNGARIVSVDTVGYNSLKYLVGINWSDSTNFKTDTIKDTTFALDMDRFDTAAKVAIGKYHGICPEGYHIPDKSEYLTLISTVDTLALAAGFGRPDSLVGQYHIRSTHGWKARGIAGSDVAGFRMLPSLAGDTAAYLHLSMGIIGVRLSVYRHDELDPNPAHYIREIRSWFADAPWSIRSQASMMAYRGRGAVDSFTIMATKQNCDAMSYTEAQCKEKIYEATHEQTFYDDANGDGIPVRCLKD